MSHKKGIKDSPEEFYQDSMDISENRRLHA